MAPFENFGRIDFLIEQVGEHDLGPRFQVNPKLSKSYRKRPLPPPVGSKLGRAFLSFSEERMQDGPNKNLASAH